jgi:hypothetical protein
MPFGSFLIQNAAVYFSILFSTSTKEATNAVEYLDEYDGIKLIISSISYGVPLALAGVAGCQGKSASFLTPMIVGTFLIDTVIKTLNYPELRLEMYSGGAVGEGWRYRGDETEAYEAFYVFMNRAYI